MTFISVLLVVAGLLALSFLIVLVISLSLRNLRTVPKPPDLEEDTLKLFTAETRAGIQLHKACYMNDPEAASNALTMWAWASGEPAVANNLDRKMDALRRPELRLAIQDLWKHLDSEHNPPWFGDALWQAFVATHPEFNKVELTI